MSTQSEPKSQSNEHNLDQKCEDKSVKSSSPETVPKSVPKSVERVVLKGPKNWDQIVKQLEEEDKDEDQNVDNMFKKLYANADDDTRRAMMKSFVESKGTSLSMDWKSVGKKFVKPYDERHSEDESDLESHDDCH